MTCVGQDGTMTTEPDTYPGYRFPAEVICHAVWLYHVFILSLRDVELILAERGITVTHESIWQWCLTFGGEFARKLRKRRPKPGDTWHLDEVILTINGELQDLWRAVTDLTTEATDPAVPTWQTKPARCVPPYPPGTP
jgi:putative transposase